MSEFLSLEWYWRNVRRYPSPWPSYLVEEIVTARQERGENGDANALPEGDRRWMQIIKLGGVSYGPNGRAWRTGHREGAMKMHDRRRKRQQP